MSPKKIAYIASFTILGLLIAFLVDALFELTMINLLTANFKTYSLGLTWQDWFALQFIGATALFVFGAYMGLRGGKYWWQIIYVDKRFMRRWKKNK